MRHVIMQIVHLGGLVCMHVNHVVIDYVLEIEVHTY